MRSILLIPTLLIASAAQAAAPIAGRWLTDDGKAVVQIGACGNAMCGRIVKILAPTPKGPPVDENNPDKRLRTRPIQGLQVLSGFTPDGDEWKGRVYSPEEGKTYKSVLRHEANGDLKVQGCVLFFCKTQHWKPVR